MRLFSVLLISLALLPLSTALKCYTKNYEEKTQIEKTCEPGYDYCGTSAYYGTDGIQFHKRCTKNCPVKDGCIVDANEPASISRGELVDRTQCCCKGDLCNKDDHLKATPTATKCYTKDWEDKTQIEDTCETGYDYCKTYAYHDTDGIRFYKGCTMLKDCPVEDGDKRTTGCMTDKYDAENSKGEKVHKTKCCCKGNFCNKDDHLAATPTTDRYFPAVFPHKCYTKGWEDKTQFEQTCGGRGEYCKTSAYYDTDGIRFHKRCTGLEDCPVKEGGKETTGCKTYKKHTTNSIGQEVDLTQCCCQGLFCNEDDHLKATNTSDRYLPTP